MSPVEETMEKYKKTFAGEGRIDEADIGNSIIICIFAYDVITNIQEVRC